MNGCQAYSLAVARDLFVGDFKVALDFGTTGHGGIILEDEYICSFTCISKLLDYEDVPLQKGHGWTNTR